MDGKFVSLKDDVSFKYLFLNGKARLHFIGDALGIPVEEIRSVRFANTFLWRRYIREVRDMGLGRTFRALRDARMKEIRDRNARDDYVRMEGHASGLAEGLAEGEDRMNRLILSLIQDGRQEDIEKAARDKEYRDRLYKEYEI